MEIHEIKDRIDHRRKELTFWYDRMESDKKRYHLEAYQMKYQNGKVVPDADNVTGNHPLAVAQSLQSDLANGNTIIIVESDTMSDNQKQHVKHFCEDVGIEMDKVCIGRNGYSAAHQIQNFMIVRGSAFAFLISQVEGGDYIADLDIADPRYCQFEFKDADTIGWVSHDCELSMDEVERRYGKYGVKVYDKLNKVTPYVDDERWLIYLKNQVLEVPHDFKEAPVIVQPSGMGSVLTDPTAPWAHWGESAFWATRDLYDYMNFILTVEMSTLRDEWRPPLKSTGPTEEELGPTVPPMSSGDQRTIPLRKGEMLERLYPPSNVERQVQTLKQYMEEQLQQGTFHRTGLGAVEFKSGMSNAWTETMIGSKQQLMPFITYGLSNFWAKVYRMLMRQFIGGKMRNVTIGDTGKQRKYSYTDLDKPFTMRIKFRTSYPDKDIRNYEAVELAKRHVGRRAAIEKFLDPDDIESIMIAIAEDQAQELDPLIRIYTQGRKLIASNDVSHKMMANQMYQSAVRLVSEMSGQPAPPAPGGMPSPPREPGRASLPGKSSVPVGEAPGVMV